MPTIADVRQQYPQYSDMSDAALAGALHQKFYSDMPREQFDQKVGLAAEKPKEAETSTLQRIAIDFANQGNAAGQRTTPNTAAYGQPISTEVHENDSGEAMFRDPKTGQVVPTDKNKHVILLDPSDNRLKVYGRSANTDEGVIAAAGRLLQTGLASGAPVSRVSSIAPAVEAVAPELRPGQQVVAAADRLSTTGAPVSVPRAVASDNMAVQQAGAAASNVPFAGTPLVKAAENTINQLGNKADEVAQGYGGGASVAQTGDTARGAIKDWITGESAANASKLYGEVDEFINPSVKTPLNATRDVVADIATKRSAAGLSSGKATDAVLEAVQRSEGLTYEGVKTLRTSIGETLKGGILPEGVSGSELEKIYGALSKDLATSVQAAGGPKASSAFERANQYYRLISDRRESLAKIIGADGNAPAETVFSRLESMAGSTSRADISKLAQVRKTVGASDWNELASTIVSRLGRDIEGNFTPQRFITAYGKLSPAGKDLLFKSGGKSELANHLDDIAKVASRFKMLQKFANPSGTARAGFGGLIGTGAFIEPLSTLTTVLGGHAVARALARPAAAASIAKWSRANEALVRAPNAAKVAAINSASRNLINTVGAKDLTPADFLKALQGPVPGRAQDEQQ